MDLLTEESYMRLALQMAGQVSGQTGINPTVGCVVVKEGNIVGLGAHLQRGGAHAEVHALQMAGAAAEGSTVYVTLEPCSHYGRTAPCCDRLIQQQVNKVIIACSDPNSLVAGKGISKLREHGIEVEVGLLASEALRLNEQYNKYIVHRTPFVTLKTASTLDGKIASKTGDSRWITGKQSRAYVHTLRHRNQAIMVGADTFIIDRPKLDARLTVQALSPIRIIVDSRLRIPLEVYSHHGVQSRTIVLTTEQAPAAARTNLQSSGIETVNCGDGPKVDLPLALRLLGEMEIGSILLEGGGRLNGAMLEAQLIDKMILFFAPKIIGGDNAPANFSFTGYERMEEAIRLQHTAVEMIGDDICLSGYPNYGGGGD